MIKYFWYFSKHTPKADVVFSGKNPILYGYTDEPRYEFIEQYDLRFFDYDTLGNVVEHNRYWYSEEMVEKVVAKVSLIENQRELKRLEEELKLHRSQFKEEIAELTKARDELKAENEQLRLQALEMDEDELEDGVSISWQNDFKMNLAELDDEYILMVPDEKRIRSELVASEWTKPIKGVVITKVPQLRVSVK